MISSRAAGIHIYMLLLYFYILTSKSVQLSQHTALHHPQGTHLPASQIRVPHGTYNTCYLFIHHIFHRDHIPPSNYAFIYKNNTLSLRTG